MAIKAQITLDEILILEVDVDPSVSPGIAAPIGSVANLTDGSAIYRKNSSLDTDWILMTDTYGSILNSIAFG